MTAAIPPLPAPLDLLACRPARPVISVQNLPLPGNPAPEPPRRMSLPELGNQPRFSAVETPPAPVTPPMPSPPSDYTDEDLRLAIAPLVAGVMGGGSFHDDASLEAMLRSTFRRALAEHQVGPFQQPGVGHRTLWHLQALFTSRSYDEIVSDKIRRFHVEEVYLLDRDKLSLISYASSNPVRHAHPRKVGSFARKLALRVQDDSGAYMFGFELGEGRRTLISAGQYSLLVAVIRGEVTGLAKTDLEFALKRIERRYQQEFAQGVPLLEELQPLLEECLLIHSPAAPASP
ncbi:hypothetical protein OKA04_01435 [Luteolibacter flavescens]|uniref:Uncharacterized protein n=1 Tax=Luteolibacter flavescens TaxID=1859460 RepID=A0ABT3FIU3_9BACT|nr:hypothetical protein [Luteolibacter flavescens]MCW1883372.1 hypothetical protein [Luteolibacter flavescens]